MAAGRGAILILASASPRRRELLGSLVPDFTVEPSEVEERLAPGPLAEAVSRLALNKARAVAVRHTAGIVLGADTVVAIDGVALGKPADAGDARAMLTRLCGREHEVITGVAVVDVRTGRAERVAVTSRVRMASYGEQDIDAYVSTGEPFDKAGGYAIQGAGGALVAGFDGSYSNVVGLPLAETARLLAAFGVAVSEPPVR